jgi:hypothetical protein
MTANLCWMRSSLLTSVDVIEFQTKDAYSRDEKVRVMLRTKLNSLVQREN